MDSTQSGSAHDGRRSLTVHDRASLTLVHKRPQYDGSRSQPLCQTIDRSPSDCPALGDEGRGEASASSSLICSARTLGGHLRKLAATPVPPPRARMALASQAVLRTACAKSWTPSVLREEVERAARVSDRPTSSRRAPCRKRIDGMPPSFRPACPRPLNGRLSSTTRARPGGQARRRLRMRAAFGRLTATRISPPMRPMRTRRRVGGPEPSTGADRPGSRSATV